MDHLYDDLPQEARATVERYIGILSRTRDLSKLSIQEAIRVGFALGRKWRFETEFEDIETESWEIRMPGELHPDTKNLVGSFATSLATKLYNAQHKYGYSNGWLDDSWLNECREKLIKHINKGDPLDVAAYCAFLWYHHSFTSEMYFEEDFRKDFEAMHAGRDLTRHHLRGTYSYPPMAALWNQHVKTLKLLIHKNITDKLIKSLDGDKVSGG